MFSNTALDVFIGLVFIYLLYSLLATIVQEMIAVRLSFRAKVLEKAIIRMLEDGETKSPSPFLDRIYGGLFHLLGFRNLLKDKQVATWFYAHPLIKNLGEDNYYSKPAYLDAGNFSKVLLDLLQGAGGNNNSNIVQAVNDSIVKGTIYKLPVNIAKDKGNPSIKALMQQSAAATAGSNIVPVNNDTALLLRTLWNDAGADIDAFRLKLENWYDATMQRATGWYKRYTQVILFIIGMTIAVIFNVDTIAIRSILSKDKTAREQMVNMAINSSGRLTNIADSSLVHDSLLRDAYKMVAEDANNANAILGLGRPWKDTCKMCREIYVNGNITDAASHKLDSLKDEADTISNFKKLSLLFKKELDAAQHDTSKNKQSIINDLNLKIQGNDSTLNKHEEEGLADSIKKMQGLMLRCPRIIKEMEAHWFKYSPNQTGGPGTFLGWILTALAISLGAPFWFDLLNKLIRLRGSGTKITAD